MKIVLLLLLYTLSGKQQSGTFGYKDSTGVVRYISTVLPPALSDSAFEANPTLWTTRMKKFDDSLQTKYHR